MQITFDREQMSTNVDTPCGTIVTFPRMHHLQLLSMRTATHCPLYIYAVHSNHLAVSRSHSEPQLMTVSGQAEQTSSWPQNVRQALQKI